MISKYLMAFLFVAASPALAIAQKTFSDSDIRQMLVTRVDRQKWATGIIVGVVTRVGHRAMAYGTTTRGGERKIDGNTIYDIGSVTKVFTALALADMVKRGEVSLDDPVTKYLPPGTVLPHDGERQITLADLATHTSGLPLRPGNLASTDPNKYANYSEADLYRFLATYKPAHAIGSTYDYSNVGFGLLGLALSRRAGVPYDTLIRERILQPLGMNRTSRELNPAMKRSVAAGYDYDNADLVPAEHWDFGNGLAGAGGYRSCANDMIKFIDAVLGYRKSSLSAALAAMTETRRPGGMQPATSIALAWNILDQDGREIAWKNGSVGGFRAFIGYDRAAGVGVVALANGQTATGVDDIALHILDPKIPVDLHIPRKHIEVAIDPALLDQYVGTYKYSDTDFAVVTCESGHLFWQEGPDKLEMFAEGAREFFFKALDAQVTFELGPDGRASAAVWHQAGQNQRGLRLR
jgi:D-alanyl-D-alanine-carboxypeptidase/D-alanyl-D-alanine-endopeptidase